MKKREKSSGNTREQLAIPGLEGILSSVDSGGYRPSVGKNTYDPTWWDSQSRPPVDKMKEM